MLVKHAMTRGAEAIGPGETLQAAARRMRALDVGALVVSEGDRVLGVITDRDVVVRAVADGRDPRQAAVREAMTPQVVTCAEEDQLEAAAMAMQEHAVRRLPVVDEEGRLRGMLSVDDLSQVDRPLAARVLEHVRAPERFEPGSSEAEWTGEGRWP
jgi:CBS domain-containing protein